MGARTSQLLIDAVKADDRPTVLARIAAGDDVDWRDAFFRTALSYAAELGNEELVTLLIDHGAAIDLPHDAPRDGIVLEYAVSGGHLPVIQLLLKRGARPTGSALNLAAVNGQLAIVNLLLDNEAPLVASPNGSTALLALCIFGPQHVRPLPIKEQCRTLERLITSGADVNARDGIGTTPLLSAVRIGNEPVVELLLRHGADPNAPDASAARFLLTSVRDTAMAKRLFAAGIGEGVRREAFWHFLRFGPRLLARSTAETFPAEERDSFLTGVAFLEAVEEADLEEIRRMGVEATALFTQFGGFALLTAVQIHHQDRRRATTRLLLEIGVNKGTPAAGFLSLCAAVTARDLVIVRMLLRAGVNPNLGPENADTPLMVAFGSGDWWNERAGPATRFEPAVDEMAATLIDAGAEVNARGGEGRTSLLCAMHRYPHNLERLFAAGANVNQVANDGWTPLMAADEKQARRLLKAGALANAQGCGGQTALHLCGSLGKAQVLVEHGADPDAQDDAGRTPLIAQAAAGRLAIVEWLTSVAKNLDARDKDGVTALLAAATSGHEDVVALLAKRGATLHGIDRFNRTSLIGGCYTGKSGIVRLALAAGVPLDVQDLDGSTALMRAAAFGYDEIVRMLIARGVNLVLRDRFGRTALDQALVFGRKETAKLLADASAE